MPLDLDVEFFVGALNGMRKDIQILKTPKPIHRQSFGTATVPSGGPTCIVATDYPPVGRFWEITGFGAYTVNSTTLLPDLHTSVAGVNVDFFSGPGAGTDSPGDLSAVVGTSAIGVTTWLGDKKPNAYGNDKLYAWVYGVTAPTIIAIVFNVMDWRIQDRVEMTV